MRKNPFNESLDHLVIVCNDCPQLPDPLLGLVVQVVANAHGTESQVAVVRARVAALCALHGRCGGGHACQAVTHAEVTDTLDDEQAGIGALSVGVRERNTEMEGVLRILQEATIRQISE